MRRMLFVLPFVLGASLVFSVSTAPNVAAGAAGCAPGEYLDASGACVPAALGHYADGSIQIECPVGYYQDQEGQDRCKSAPVGSYVAGPGATTSTDCPIGSYQPLTAQTGCLEADAGHFVASTGSDSQEECAPGRFQPDPGQDHCTSASKGYYTPGTGSTDQTPCPVGTYADVEGLARCSPASAGHFVNTTAAESDTPCPAGTYQPQEGRTGCLDASPGHYVPSSGATSQTLCPTGRFQPGTGSTFCKAAEAGFYVGERGATGQKSAPPGSHVPVEESFEPTPCPAGTYQPEAGQVDCIDADPGHYAPGEGAVEQLPCPVDTFQSEAGAFACLGAAPGHFVGDVVFDADGNVTGFASIVGAIEQTPCPLGYYQPDAGQSDCVQAEFPEFVDQQGAVQPSRCSAGEYRLIGADGSGDCVPCPLIGAACGLGFITSEDGYYVYRDSGGNSETYDCPVGLCLDHGSTTTTSAVATTTTVPDGTPILSALDDMVNHFGDSGPIVDLVATLDQSAEAPVTAMWQLIECAEGLLQCPTSAPVVASGTFEIPAGSRSASTTYTVPWECTDPSAESQDDLCNRSFLLILSDPVGTFLGRPVAAISVYGMACPPGQYHSTDGECLDVPDFGVTGSDGEIIAQEGFYGPTDVGIESEYVHLTTIEPDADGVVTAEIVVPAGIEPGDHHLVFAGIGRFGIVREVRVPVTVVEAQVDIETPTDTDSAGFPWFLFGGLLVAGSAVAIGLRRRA